MGVLHVSMGEKRQATSDCKTIQVAADEENPGDSPNGPPASAQDARIEFHLDNESPARRERDRSRSPTPQDEAMYAEVDTFIGNHTDINAEVFQLWVQGNSIYTTAEKLQQRGALQGFPGATFDLLLADVVDHYRNYGALEKLLQSPSRINDQWVFQLLPGARQTVIEMYYDFDDSVMIEIQRMKLSMPRRKDLDDVCEKTGVNMKSCRRQFDNLKRVYRAVEALSGSVLLYIMNRFCLPDDLARKYCTIIFIATNRFETNKRKLHYLTFQDFHTCALSMMTHWTSSMLDDKSTLEMEREFLMELRGLQNLLDREEDHKSLVCKLLKGKISDRIYLEVESNFKVYSRTLINIAYGLTHSRELKDLFIDLVEKYIDPCKHVHWPPTDMKQFLQVYTDAAYQLDVLRSQPTLKAVWKRYLDGISGCIIAMYHS